MSRLGDGWLGTRWIILVIIRTRGFAAGSSNEEHLSKISERALQRVEDVSVAHGDGSKRIRDSAKTRVQDLGGGAVVGARLYGERRLYDGGDELRDFNLVWIGVGRRRGGRGSVRSR